MIAADARESTPPVVGDAHDQAEFVRLIALLATASNGEIRLVTAAGESLPLPEALRRVLTAAADVLARGKAVRLVPMPPDLSETEAAAVLGVSRPQLTVLLDEEVIPSRRAGTRRLIGLLDLYAYMAQRHTRSIDLLGRWRALRRGVREATTSSCLTAPGHGSSPTLMCSSPLPCGIRRSGHTRRNAPKSF
jgi:excisionase family DNA binding protein